jgi:hypothetical protein
MKTPQEQTPKKAYVEPRLERHESLQAVVEGGFPALTSGTGNNPAPF